MEHTLSRRNSKDARQIVLSKEQSIHTPLKEHVDQGVSIQVVLDGKNTILYFPSSSSLIFSVNRNPFSLCSFSRVIPSGSMVSVSQSIQYPYSLTQSDSSIFSSSEMGTSSKSRLQPQRWHHIGSAPVSASNFKMDGFRRAHKQSSFTFPPLVLNWTAYPHKNQG